MHVLIRAHRPAGALGVAHDGDCLARWNFLDSLWEAGHDLEQVADVWDRAHNAPAEDDEVHFLLQGADMHPVDGHLRPQLDLPLPVPQQSPLPHTVPDRIATTKTVPTSHFRRVPTGLLDLRLQYGAF